MNNYQGVGRLTRDPELQELPGGGTVCRMRVAVPGMGRGRDEGGGLMAGFVDVAEFGDGGRAAAQYLHRGSQVAVTGGLKHREWTDREGNRRQGYEIHGHVEFLDTRAGEQNLERETGLEEQQQAEATGPGPFGEEIAHLPETEAEPAAASAEF